MKVAIGSDHAGFPLKEVVRETLSDYTWLDCGAYDTSSCDYPDYARAVVEQLQSGAAEFGILVCGTGVGMSMAANRYAGIRAAACSETYTARLTRAHNDANILCIGARVIGAGVAEELIRVWLSTEFEGGERHCRRLRKIQALETSPQPKDV